MPESKPGKRLVEKLRRREGRMYQKIAILWKQLQATPVAVVVGGSGALNRTALRESRRVEHRLRLNTERSDRWRKHRRFRRGKIRKERGRRQH